MTANWGKVKRVAVITGATLLALVALVLLTAWIGSSIPRNSDWAEPGAGVEIMVETNGIHTAIVMPLITPQKDWREDFPARDIIAANRPYTHISVSWGERDVFLNTPTWADLSLTDAIDAATGGEGLLHIAYYVRPAPAADIRPLRITPDQYARLVRRIETQILPPDQRTIHPGYGSYDVFYDAPGIYHFGNTCNQWTSDTLAAAGVKTGWWTPLAGGVMKWVPNDES